MGIALVDMSAVSSVHYRNTLAIVAVTSTSAKFNISLSRGWVKVVYRWIVSKGEPLVTTVITLGPTVSGPLSVPLPSGTSSTFPHTSVEKVDTLIAGFDYTNAGALTGLSIQIRPVIPTKNPVYDDFTTDVNQVDSRLISPPITTASNGSMTLNLQITLPNGAILSRIIFTVILHTVA